MSDEKFPAFFEVCNPYFVIIGVALIIVANITPFVFGTFLNIVGMVTWPLGMTLLYLNYRKVKQSAKPTQTLA